MWYSNNLAFSVTETPEKWENESAIIIAKYHRLEYKKIALSNELLHNDYFHQRIKLNDKNAINKYAELSFPTGRIGHDVYVGFKVIKPNGKEFIVDNNDAVEIKAESGNNKKGYMKLAIPKLEVGDILDYYICDELTLVLGEDTRYCISHSFSPVQYCLHQEYPIIEQQIELKAQRRCSIALRSTNGAPEFKLKVNEETGDNYYSLVDKNRDKLDGIRWFYPYRALPTIKFKVDYVSKKYSKKKWNVLLGKPGIAKSSILEDELITFIKSPVYSVLNVSIPRKYVKENIGKKGSDIDKAKWGYYSWRHYRHEKEEVKLISNYKMGSFYLDNDVSERYYLDFMHCFLKVIKVPHEIVVAADRDIADVDEIILDDEMRYFIRLKDGDKYFYLTAGNKYSFPGQLPPEVVNTKAYIINPADWSIKKEFLNTDRDFLNTENTNLSLVISDDLKTCKIHNTSSIDGNQRHAYQKELIDYYDRMADEEAYFHIYRNFKGALYSDLKKLNSLKASYLDNKETYVNNNLKDLVVNMYDFSIDTVNSFICHQTGIYDDKPEFKFSYNMQTEDLIHKVGRNYILDVGKLIQGQVKIEKEELNRKQDIYMYSSRKYNYTIKVDLPDGYTVQGLDKLNINVENDQGGFMSTASIESGQIVINTSKFYNQYFSKAETWDNYIDFLNAAYKFTEQKLLIKKL